MADHNGKSDTGRSSSNRPSEHEREESQDGVNSGGVIAFVFSMVVTFACFIYVSFFSGGVDLKEVKATDGSGAAQTIAAAAKTEEKIDVSGITEPWLPSEKMVKHGAAIFKMNCAMCHGVGGAGDGVAGASLNPKPRNLIEGKWKQGGSSLQLFATLQAGIPGGSMQGYKDALPAKDRWALVQFIRSITKDLVADNEADLKTKAPSLN
jgi:mono/diheme cytochrome c family protein